MGIISFIKDMFCTDTHESKFPEEYKPTYPDKERLKVIAKSISCNDAEYMYHCKEEQPGCCPVCYCKPLDEQWLWRAKYRQPCCGVYYFAGGPYMIKSKECAITTDDFIAKTQILRDRNKGSAWIIIGLSTMKAMQDYGLKGV